MPLIDVSEVLRDNLIAGEPFLVIRRQETVTTGGLVQLQVIRCKAFGSVQPGESTLVREEAQQFKNDTIKVVTNFMLRGVSKDSDGKSFQPDIVKWQGSHYIVTTTNDYNRYGVGMIEAECQSIDYRDEAPTAPETTLPFG